MFGQAWTHRNRAVGSGHGSSPMALHLPAKLCVLKVSSPPKTVPPVGDLLFIYPTVGVSNTATQLMPSVLARTTDIRKGLHSGMEGWIFNKMDILARLGKG